jgi:predicted amidophosphoribosyltransferase
MKLRIWKKKRYLCFSCKKNLVNRRHGFCKKCRDQLKKIDGSFLRDVLPAGKLTGHL